MPASSPEVPVEWRDELEKIRQAVARNGRPSFAGRILRFRKGEWVLGQDKKKVPDKSRFIGIMGEARHGVMKWVNETTEDGDKKRVPIHVIGKIIEGFQPPDREELDCQNKEEWKVGLSGKPEDPWKRVAYLPLLSLSGEQVMTFSTDTPTGLPRFWQLMDRYGWMGQQHPGQYPIIELQASGYDDRRYGWVDTPDFQIVGWTGRPDPAALLTHNDGTGAEDGGPPADEPVDADRWERE